MGKIPIVKQYSFETKIFGYEISVNVSKENQEIKEIYQKFKNGEILTMNELTKLQENDLL